MPWWGLAAVLTAWSLGIMAEMLLSPLAPCLWLVAAIAAGACILRRDLVLLVGLALAALVLGVGRAALASGPDLPAAISGQAVLVTGAVDDDPIERKGNRRFPVRVDQVRVAGTELKSDLRLEVTVYGITPVHYGDLVLLTGEIQPPPRFEQFDYRAYLAEQGIAGVVPSARLVRVTTHTGDPFHSALFAIRHGLIEAVDRALPEPQAALVLGVVFGYRAALPAILEQQMIASGLIHIVVISGLKVSLLARLISEGMGRWLPRAAPVVALGAMVSYALLAGASAAALRAAGMGMLVVVAGRLQRQSQVAVSLALTSAVMLALRPSLAGDVSFQLSFAGTIGIASMTDGITARLKLVPALLRDPFAATVAAEAATWPLMLANFHQLSLIGPAANALVLPLLPAIIVVGGTGAIAAIAASAIGWPLMQAAGLIATWFRIVIETLGSIPVAAIAAPYFPSRWLAAATIVNGSALAGIKLRQFFWRRPVWAALGGFGVVAISALLIRPDGRVHVYALDVGTGSAVLVRTAHGHQALINAGPDADRFAHSVGRALPPTARTLDIWLITGGRRTDIGAGPAVLKRFSIARMVIADPDPWSATLRVLVQQAQASGVPVSQGNGPLIVDGVSLNAAADGRTWVVNGEAAAMAIVPPETAWESLPVGLDGAIFTSGGPLEWQGPGLGFSVIQVAAASRDGLPTRALVHALAGAPIYRVDRLGTVELIRGGDAFTSAR